MQKDKETILAKIGDGSKTLDDKVHSVVAASALERLSQSLQLDTQENMAAIVDALTEDKCIRVLSISTKLVTSLPNNLCVLTSLTSLNMNNCISLLTVPEGIDQLTCLTELGLNRCSSIKELPSSVSKLTALTALNLEGCKSLSTLPACMSELVNLIKLNLCNCERLEVLPDLSEIKGLEKIETGLSRNKEGVVYVRGICLELVHSWRARGHAPGCSDGLGGGYGVLSVLFPWLR